VTKVLDADLMFFLGTLDVLCYAGFQLDRDAVEYLAYPRGLVDDILKARADVIEALKRRGSDERP